MPINEFLNRVYQQIKDLNDAFAGTDAKQKREQMLKAISSFKNITDDELQNIEDVQLKKQLPGLRASASTADLAAKMAIIFAVLSVVAVILVVIFAGNGGILLSIVGYATVIFLVISTSCIATAMFYNSLIRSKIQIISAYVAVTSDPKSKQSYVNGLGEFLISIKMLQVVFDKVSTLQAPPVVMNENFFKELMHRKVKIASPSGAVDIKDIFSSIAEHALKAIALGEHRGQYINYRLASLGLVFSSAARDATYSRGVALQQIGDAIRASHNHSDEYLIASIPAQYREHFLRWAKLVHQQLGIISVDN